MSKIRSRFLHAAGVIALALAPSSAIAQPVLLTPDQDADFTSSLQVIALEAFNLALPDQPDPTRPLKVSARIAGQDVTLTLAVHSLRTDDTRLWLDQGDGALVQAPLPPVRTMRGSVDQWPGSTVAASLMPGAGLRATVIHDRQAWTIQPAREANPRADRFLHVVYHNNDLLDTGHVCGVDEGKHTPDAKDEGASFRLRGSSGCFPLCEIAFDADFEFYQSTNSSEDDVIAEIESIMNGVDVIFRRDVGVTFGLTEFIVRTTSSDPYVSTNPNGQLNEIKAEFQNNTQIRRDCLHLFTGKELDTDTVGLAWIGVICNRAFHYGLSQSYYSPSFARRTRLTAHELGHNYAAPHDNEQGSTCGSTPAGFVMNPSINSGGDFFSACSVSRITPHRDSRTCTPEGANVPPNTTPDTETTFIDTPVLVDVLANDADSCDDLELLLFANLSSNAGTIEITEEPGPDGRFLIRYTPPSGFTGDDTFMYTARGGNGLLAQETVTVTVSLGREPENPVNTEFGLDVDYYVLNFPAEMPDFSQLTSYASSTLPFINFGPAAGAVITSGRPDNVGAVMTGFIDIPTAGKWTFCLNSDDGSRLYIGDELVVDNDGERVAPAEVAGEIPLAPGKHAFTVEYFEKVGTAGVILSMEGPGFAKQVIGSFNYYRLVPCSGDWNQDGLVNNTDFFDFVNDFFSQSGPQGQSDFNQDGFENAQDWFDFVNEFFAPDC